MSGQTQSRRTRRKDDPGLPRFTLLLCKLQLLLHRIPCHPRLVAVIRTHGSSIHASGIDPSGLLSDSPKTGNPLPVPVAVQDQPHSLVYLLQYVHHRRLLLARLSLYPSPVCSESISLNDCDNSSAACSLEWNAMYPIATKPGKLDELVLGWP